MVMVLTQTTGNKITIHGSGSLVKFPHVVLRTPQLLSACFSIYWKGLKSGSEVFQFNSRNCWEGKTQDSGLSLLSVLLLPPIILFSLTCSSSEGSWETPFGHRPRGKQSWEMVVLPASENFPSLANLGSPREGCDLQPELQCCGIGWGGNPK